MPVRALLFILIMLARQSEAADAAIHFKAEPVKLRSLPVQKLYTQSPQTSFELSAETLTKKLEADLSRFKAMNGRDLLDVSPKPAPATPAQRLLDAFFPKGGTLLGKNPNAPPNKFTR
jgi:hypothetical protein